MKSVPIRGERKSVPIRGESRSHSVSRPTEIFKLFRPIKFCGGNVRYSLAAWTNYLDDICEVKGSLVFIALREDLPKWGNNKKVPFMYVHSQFTRRSGEFKVMNAAKTGQKFSFPCGCTYKVVPLKEFPQDETFDIIITGHNVDER